MKAYDHAYYDRWYRHPRHCVSKEPDRERKVHLVLFQLNRANGANAVQRMLKPAEFTVTIAKVPVDATTPGDMIRVVRVCDREASQHPELRLDQIEPRRVSGSPHRLDAQSPQQGEERGMVVDVAQVIHDDE